MLSQVPLYISAPHMHSALATMYCYNAINTHASGKSGAGRPLGLHGSDLTALLFMLLQGRHNHACSAAAHTRRQ
eukprot:COSAG01_NODE_10937_length_2043_cov_24.532922_3_plen_74_part_00